MKNQPWPQTMYGIFPCPVYTVKRDLDLSLKEDKDIEDVIKGGMHKSHGNSISDNTYIFDDKLKEIKQFCEQQINIYVEEIINPEEEIDFYITQSWVNVSKPGEGHHLHHHPNSIISGVFYIATEEDDNIMFNDPNEMLKSIINFRSKEQTVWNSSNWTVPVNNNQLILFPSWLHHQVPPNEKATTDRISLSFNTFVKGTLGIRNELTELILK